jgi:hypothetical protein
VLLLRSCGLDVSEVEATGLFTLVNIVDDMTGEGTEALPSLIFFGNRKAYVASQAYDDETIECSKTQLSGTDPSPTMACDELAIGISKPSGDIMFASMITDSGEPVDKLN